MKHLNASVGVHTIGSPRTLNDVFTTNGHPVKSLNFDITAWKRGFVSACTVWILAE